MSVFIERLRAQWEQDKFVCVGLDSKADRLPLLGPDKPGRWDQLSFNDHIIAATNGVAAAYKLNSAFYEAAGSAGLETLAETVDLIRGYAPDALVILDYKRADIDSTNEGYVQLAFDRAGVDAVTVHNYLGMEAMRPFLDQGDKGIIVLCRTSNKGAGEFQDRRVPITRKEAEEWGLQADTTMPLYQLVAWRVSREWNYNGNCALVTGATYPEELANVRYIAPSMPLLIPGIGAQGGGLGPSLEAAIDGNGQGFLVNASRSIIFASGGPDFAEAAGREAQSLHDAINEYRAGFTA